MFHLRNEHLVNNFVRGTSIKLTSFNMCSVNQDIIKIRGRFSKFSVPDRDIYFFKLICLFVIIE